MNLLKILCLFSLSFSAAAVKPMFIGGFQPDFIRHGTVRIGSENILGHCTATFVSPVHILTAAHCIATAPHVLLNFGTPPSSFPPPYNETIEVLLAGNKKQQEHITVTNVYLFPKTIFGTNEDKVSGKTEEDQTGHLLEVGDFAIVKIDRPVASVKSFSKILFSKSIPTDAVWVGGFGRKSAASSHFETRSYSGTYAKLGKMENAFYLKGDGEFKKESNVSVQLINAPKDISYLGTGDSGGAVFIQRGTTTFITGVNHASHYGTAQGLKINPQTGLVLERPAGATSGFIGFAHHFSSKNVTLVNWVKSILPQGSYVIE